MAAASSADLATPPAVTGKRMACKTRRVASAESQPLPRSFRVSLQAAQGSVNIDIGKLRQAAQRLRFPLGVGSRLAQHSHRRLGNGIAGNVFCP